MRSSNTARLASSNIKASPGALRTKRQVQATTGIGWRLPTRDEIKTLASADGKRLVENELVSDLTDSECNYWTSTPFKALDGAAAKLYYIALIRVLSRQPRFAAHRVSRTSRLRDG